MWNFVWHFWCLRYLCLKNSKINLLQRSSSMKFREQPLSPQAREDSKFSWIVENDPKAVQQLFTHTRTDYPPLRTLLGICVNPSRNAYWGTKRNKYAATWRMKESPWQVPRIHLGPCRTTPILEAWAKLLTRDPLPFKELSKGMCMLCSSVCNESRPPHKIERFCSIFNVNK